MLHHLHLWYVCHGSPSASLHDVLAPPGVLLDLLTDNTLITPSCDIGDNGIIQGIHNRSICANSTVYC